MVSSPFTYSSQRLTAFTLSSSTFIKISESCKALFFPFLLAYSCRAKNTPHTAANIKTIVVFAYTIANITIIRSHTQTITLKISSNLLNAV